MEASRVFPKLPGRNAVLVGMLIAGLFAHSVFLVNQFTATGPDGPKLLANWFQWSVLGAWGLALAYLILTIRNPQSSLGLFLIPLILGFIGLGVLVRGSEPFHAQTTINIWLMIHGVSLLVGAMFICFGVAFGIMYLLKSHRLKSKRQASQTFRLPALDFLQSMNRLSLFTTAISLTVGLLSAVVLNVSQEGQVNWLSSLIVVTCALFLWSVVAASLELSSRGSLGGRRSAYLVIANFLFLVLVLGIVLWTSHGQDVSATAASPENVGELGLELSAGRRIQEAQS
jgi:hypothetical protein